MQIYLIGYMGVGKTTIGKKLASRLSFDFLDLDVEIEKSHQKSISQIFAERGEAYFRQIEREKLLEINGQNTIIATGGGSPCFDNNIQIMLKKGIVVWLQLDAVKIAGRLVNSKSTRPIIAHLPEEEVFQFVEKQLNEREKFYRMAHIQFDVFNLNKKKLDKLISKINGYTK